ncbi:Plasmodium exported protein, unknown function [Plasmodium knowlesi strain H]|uniref:Fam-b protein n=3 Tax=Plasmodium knowlesi TaxID=5850 RepID=A0A679L8L7_PLAKH|nr:Plasmodium exported protein, unknown function [Plasmodium knowlesi strain H]OTN64090.1 Uncharacterized protein PKNOH_S140291400 [Plasmodium knowlesi]CAA9991322.1 Plasmodium exported protein, unknown function [Plasmodium knowlesi strain H]SBO28971.1 Plasmodium exported protein, unknown function [Plasmodium knowlesi strain H]VVS80796.1 Plasmodium exported protein, unknown function [Plasmodium knowlesi strain H]
MYKLCLKFFIYTLLIWALCSPCKENVGEEYSYQSEQIKTLHLRDGRILIEDGSMESHSKCVSESSKWANTEKIGNQESKQTGIVVGAHGSTYHPMDEKDTEEKKHLKGIGNNINGPKSNSNKKKKNDVSVSPSLFAELLLKKPEKGIDILMLYAGGFLKYASNCFF